MASKLKEFLTLFIVSTIIIFLSYTLMNLLISNHVDPFYTAVGSIMAGFILAIVLRKI